MVKKRKGEIGVRFTKAPKRATCIGKGGIEANGLDTNGYGRIKKDFRLRKKNEVRQMGSYKVVQHHFCKGITITSTIPKKDLKH